jgi:hypothetical protein
MQFPTLREVARNREMTTIFGGYNHQISCSEGQFFDMKNITSRHFPVLSPRQNRGIVKSFVNPQGILDKEDIWWIDDKTLYKNGKKEWLTGVSLSDEAPKTLAKMGAYIIIMPDKIWYNTEDGTCGYMERINKTEGADVNFSLCDANGAVIDWHDAAWYENKANRPNGPKEGDYLMTTTAAGKPSLKVYSATTSIWLTVATTYMQITCTGIGIGFKKEDGVKITSNFQKGLEYIFVNEEVNDEGEKLYSTNTYIVDKTDDSITIPGIYNSNYAYAGLKLVVERKVPDMAFITECNNRLWGCSKDGHEIYCCKLGDVKNWNCFMGVSTDSWAATIGSDGKFTGAVTYLGYPIFFKEDSLIKISVSSTGGHQTKETKCRGVQYGSDRSLAILNETLFYKSSTCVCAYNGSLPYSISEDLGDVRYYDAVAGAIGDSYYISMRNAKNEYNLFVFDSKNGIWCKEDHTEALAFCRHSDELYFIDAKDKTMKSVGGTLLYGVPEERAEGRFDWYAESGPIGYSSPDNKYIARINIRLTLELGTNVDFYLQYDSSEEWEHIFNMSGKGTRTYSVPIIPKRCDHFRYKITGKGDCKIHSVTKATEEGSDI